MHAQAKSPEYSRICWAGVQARGSMKHGEDVAGFQRKAPEPRHGKRCLMNRPDLLGVSVARIHPFRQ